ncbi:hypothetical protein JHK84_039806 [Glycine max]|nr:hypothetical protein JHK84_039806 [Glycine max]
MSKTSATIDTNEGISNPTSEYSSSTYEEVEEASLVRRTLADHDTDNGSRVYFNIARPRSNNHTTKAKVRPNHFPCPTCIS